MAFDPNWKKDMQTHIAGGTQLEGENLKRADYTQDGKVDIKDVTAYEKQNTPLEELAGQKVDKDAAAASAPAKTTTLNATSPTAPTTPTTKQPSQVDAAMQKLDGELQPYNSSWQQNMLDTLTKLQNRDPFSYDLNGDMLYHQYAEQFGQSADKAMRDTVGQVSALTGGYANSYAQTAGQQAYADTMSGLNDVIPELYQLALNKYNQEGQDLKDMLSIYQSMDESEYNRYINDRNYNYQVGRDEVNDAWRESEALRDQGNIDREFGFMESEAERDQGNKDREFSFMESEAEREQGNIDREFNQKVLEWNTSIELEKMSLEQQQEQFDKTFSLEEKAMLSDSYWRKIALEIRPNNAECIAAGETPESTDENMRKYKIANTTSVSSGGGKGAPKAVEATPSQYSSFETKFTNMAKSEGWEAAYEWMYNSYANYGLSEEQAKILGNNYYSRYQAEQEKKKTPTAKGSSSKQYEIDFNPKYGKQVK